MTRLFPHANIVVGVLIFIIGFCVHWIGQLISIINWDFAKKLGLQEKKLLPEYKVYEHAIAVADTAMAWLYGIASIGLFLDAEWGYKLTWIPGSILLYHAISAWVWESNRRAAGHQLWPNSLRIGWCGANAITGILAILVAWKGSVG